MKYKVVTVTNNLTDYPQLANDTSFYSYLVEHVEDEVETFVVSKSDSSTWWTAEDFFDMNDIKEFEVIS